MELLHSPLLPADYYRKQAARVRLLPADATAGDIKAHLQEVALQYDRLRNALRTYLAGRDPRRLWRGVPLGIADWPAWPHIAYCSLQHNVQEGAIAFRTNYRFQRTERERVKQAKQEEKLRKKQERDTGSAPATEPQAHPDEDGPLDRYHQ